MYTYLPPRQSCMSTNLPPCESMQVASLTKMRLHLTRSGCVMSCVLSCSISHPCASEATLLDAQPHLGWLHGRRHEAAGRVGALAARQALECARIVAVYYDQQRAPRERRQILRVQPAVALPAAARRAEAPALHMIWGL